MANETFYTAIDLGTSKVATVIARIGADGELKIVGMGVVPSQGIQQGRVDNFDEAKDAVRASFDEAQRYIGRRQIQWTYMSVSGDHITCLNTEGHITGASDEQTLTLQDMQRLIHSSYPELSHSAEVLHLIPINYEVDGLRGVRNPMGLHADQVRVESHIVLAESPVVRNLVGVVKGCKLEVRSLVAQSLASAEATLTEDERELGVVLADIGAGTIDLTIYRSGNPWYSAVIPIGGVQMTRDLSVALEVPLHEAEGLKLQWGHAQPETTYLEEEVLVQGHRGAPPRTATRQEICQPLSDRLEEIMHLLLQRVSQSGLRQLPPGGMVLTGGAAAMPGMAEMARDMSGAPTRIGSPDGIAGLPSALAEPAFSATVGTLLWGIRYQGQHRSYVNGHRTLWGYKSLFHHRKENGRGAAEEELLLATRRG